MAYKIKSDANAISLYEKFVKKNDDKYMAFIKVFNFHESLDCNYYFGKLFKVFD